MSDAVDQTRPRPGHADRRRQVRRPCRCSTRRSASPCIDIAQAAEGNRLLHLRPGLHRHRQLQVGDHLHRWRRRRAAVPRLSDRAAGQALQLPRSRLPADERRAADQGRVRQVRARSHASHDDARGLQELPRRLPPRRASDGDAGRHARLDGELLPQRPRPRRSGAAPPRRDPPDRQGADDRRRLLPPFDRLADALSAQQPRVRRRASCT